MIKNRLIALLAAVGMISTVSACGGSDGPANGKDGLTDFPLGVFSGEIYILDYVAKEKGYFEDNGLNVTFLAPSQGGGAANTFFLAGTLKGWPGNPSTIMIDMSKGEDIQIAGWLDNWISFAVQVPADSELAGLKDKPFDEKMKALKGKKIGLTGVGSLVNQSLVAGLKASGVSEKDVQVLAVGPPDAGIAQLETGRIDAYATYSRTDAAVLSEQAGSTEYVSLTGDEAPEQIRAYSSWALPVLSSFAKKNPEAVEGYVAAQKEAYAWVKDNIDEAAKILSDEVYDGKFVDIITEALNDIFSAPQPNDFKVTPEAWNNLAELMQDQGQLPKGAEAKLVYDDVVRKDASVR